MTTQFLVNGLYPLEYFTITGVDQIQYPNAYFWASRERYAQVAGDGTSYSKNGTPTAEFLELDLGRVREISYMNLSVVRSPLDITIAYDSLSSTDGSHRWVPVTPLDGEPFDLSLHYDANTKSAFHDSEFYFTDALGKQINTRFIRIQFARRDEEWPHSGATPFRWPVVVKSLRTARFIDQYLDSIGIVFDSGISPDDDASKALFAMTQAQADNPSFGSANDFVCQQFGLPSDYARVNILPNVLGFSVLVYVTPDNTGLHDPVSVASVAWELWSAPAETRNFTQVASGVKNGVDTDQRVWIDMFLAQSDPLLVPTTDVIFELRLKTLSAHVLGNPVLTEIMVADNNVPGFVLPGTSTWITAGNSGSGPAAGSNTVVFTEDVHTYLQEGDTIQRYDRLGGFTATVLSVSGDTVTLTEPYQGASAAGVLGMRVTGLRFGVAATENVAQSLCMRMWSDVGDSGRDVLGNFYRYATRRQVSSDVKVDGAPGWYSEPQPDTNAVEAMYFDLRWTDDGGIHPSVVDAIRIYPRTPGVTMHIYWTVDHSDSDTPRSRNVWDKLVWTPINATYKLTGRMTIVLPTTIRANFLKLEFTNLQAQPYALLPRPEHPAVTYKTYPTWVSDQYESAAPPRTAQDWFTPSANKGFVTLNALQYMTQPVLEFQDNERETVAGLATSALSDPTQANTNLLAPTPSTAIDPTTASKINVVTPSMYESPLTLTVNKGSILGQAVAAAQTPALRTSIRETGFNPGTPIAPFVSTSQNRVANSLSHIGNTPMWFNRVCRHIYKIHKAKFNKKAYFAGIQSVEFLRKDNTVARDEDLVVEQLWDDQMLESNTWLEDNPSQLASLLAVDGSVDVLVNYTITDTDTGASSSYTNESQVFTTNVDGSYEPVTLLNGASEQASAIVVWLQNADGSQGPIQFFLGTDFTQDTAYDDFGNLVNQLTPNVASNRLVVEHVATNIDAGTVSGQAVITGSEIYTP